MQVIRSLAPKMAQVPAVGPRPAQAHHLSRLVDTTAISTAEGMHGSKIKQPGDKAQSNGVPGLTAQLAKVAGGIRHHPAAGHLRLQEVLRHQRAQENENIASKARVAR